MKLVSVKTFDFSVEAHILRTKLENEGIPSYIFDEYIVSLNPLYSQACGGIKLKVNEFDLSIAKEIIEEGELPLTDENGIEIVCPNCGSLSYFNNCQLLKGISGVLVFLFSFVFQVYPIKVWNFNICSRCSTQFNE